MPYDQKKTEDEWFARHERDLIEELKRERSRREAQLGALMKQEEAKKNKELHWQKCPKCGSDLFVIESGRLNMECRICGGIFVERNDLEDALLKKSEERKKIRVRILRLLVPEGFGDETEAQLKQIKTEREKVKTVLSTLMNSEEARKKKDLHWMKCPNCGSDMKEAELGAGIFVDQCTVCQGIFLDAGEMQEILLQNETERFQMRRKILTMNVGETR